MTKFTQCGFHMQILAIRIIKELRIILYVISLSLSHKNIAVNHHKSCDHASGDGFV